MLKKENRMRTRFQFNITRDKGFHSRGEYFHIFVFGPDDYRDSTQIGIVVSQKVTKKAVERNRIKRLYREALRNNYAILPEKKWIVIQPTAQSLDRNYEEISTDLIKTLQKISGTD